MEGHRAFLPFLTCLNMVSRSGLNDETFYDLHGESVLYCVPLGLPVVFIAAVLSIRGLAGHESATQPTSDLDSDS